MCNIFGGGMSGFGPRRDGPLQDSSGGLRLRIPSQAFPHVRHSLLPQLLEPIPIVSQLRENLFHLRHNIILIRKRNFVTDFGIDDISRAAEIGDHRHGATGESFENDAGTVVAKRWKHQHIRGLASA